MKTSPSSQTDRFQELADELKADEDEKHWDDRMRKLAKVKPGPERPE